MDSAVNNVHAGLSSDQVQLTEVVTAHYTLAVQMQQLQPIRTSIGIRVHKMLAPSCFQKQISWPFCCAPESGDLY